MCVCNCLSYFELFDNARVDFIIKSGRGNIYIYLPKKTFFYQLIFSKLDFFTYIIASMQYYKHILLVESKGIPSYAIKMLQILKLCKIGGRGSNQEICLFPDGDN